MFNIHFTEKKNSRDIHLVLQGKKIKLVVGLGNPGDKYKNTYHNVGFMFVDFLLNALKSEFGKLPKWKSIKSFEYIKIGDSIIAKPNTFMNNSGDSIKELLHYFTIEPKDMIVIHDDSDIILNEYKTSFGRGSAGHNGIESIIKSLSSDRFLRTRIGIRNRGGRAEEFVLSKVGNRENDILDRVFEKILELEWSWD